MVRISGIDWDRTNHTHVAKHGVTPEEIEDFIFVSDYAPLVERAREDRYRVLGRASTGDYRTALVEPTDDGLFIVLSARTSVDAERKRYDEVCRSRRHEDSTAV